MDTNYANVALLLLGNGADGSTTVTDNSPSPKTVTPSGSAGISTAQSVYGGASILITGGSLSVASSADLGLGTGNFTLEFWLRRSNNNSLVNLLTLTHGGIDTVLNLDSPGGGVPAAVKFANASAGVSASAYSVVSDVFTHIACVRASGVLTTYIGGVGNTGVAFAADLGTTGSLIISTSGALIGYIDDFRLTKGVARYNADFAPPTAQFDTSGPSNSLTATAPMATVTATATGISANSLTATAPMATVTATATSIGANSLTATAPMATVTAYGGGNALASVPMATATVFGGGNGAVILPMATVASVAGSNARITVPMATVHGTAHNSTGDRAFSIAVPMAMVQAQGGANARLTVPMATLAATGTVTGMAQISATIPVAAVQASGSVSAMANADITIPMSTVIGYGGAVCSVTIGMATVDASGTTGGIGKIVATLPLFQVTATGTAQNHGSFNIVIPMARIGGGSALVATIPMATVVAIGTAVVAVSYEAYAINLTHKPPTPGAPAAVDEVTRYTNFPFTHILRYKGSYFGAAADGLYLLEGTTDAGTAIPYAVRTAIDDFGAAEKKTIDAAYFGGRLGPGATVTLTAGETGGQAYNFVTPRGQLAQGHRQKFGKGVKDRYFALGVSGTDVMRLDNLELVVNKLTRKI